MFKNTIKLFTFYEDIFGNVNKQKAATNLFKDLVEIRTKILVNPSTSVEMLKIGDDLLCIDNLSSGK